MNLFSSKVDLYEFRIQSTVWYYTSSHKVVTHNGNSYLPCVVKRSNIDDEDIDKAVVDIEFPFPLSSIASFQDLFVNKIFYSGVTATIIELYKGVPLVLFKGDVLTPSFDVTDHTMTLRCGTSEVKQKRSIYTRKFQRLCPNKIYDRYCGLNYDVLKKAATITDITGDVITFNLSVGAVANGYFHRGVIEKDGVFVFVSQMQIHNDKVTLYSKFPQLEVGDVVHVAPGCDQSFKTCHEKLSNSINFGGFPFMTTRKVVVGGDVVR